jgi:hypothetical protein
MTIVTLCVISCAFRGFTQCGDTYINNRFGIEICNSLDWEIAEKLPYILVKSNGINVSIYAELYEGELTAKEIGQASHENDKKEKPYLELKSQEMIKVDSLEAYLQITYVSPINTNTEMRSESHFITATFLFNGLKYVVNNNCYLNDCAANEKMVRDVISNLTFIREKAIVLSSHEEKKIAEFGDDLFNAIKNGDSKQFQKLLINQKNLTEGIELNMRDQEMKARFTKLVNENWEEAFNLFVKTSEESFKYLLTEGNKQNIKWAKIEFVSFTYQPHSELPDMKNVAGKLKFKFSNRIYSVDIKDMILLNDGWYIVEYKEQELQ